MEAATAYEAVSLDAPRPSSGEEESWTLADSLTEEERGYELVEIGETLRGTLEALPARERGACHFAIIKHQHPLRPAEDSFTRPPRQRSSTA